MPSAKVADGSTCKNIPMTAICKTEEDRQRDIELYKTLVERRNELEERLLQKLEELKATCINEGEIIGELPKEIYRTLMPGESEPKIKKRIGTAFKISHEILEGSYADDKTIQLEADIELHKKIVAAAERLAKDKTTNKSVRKKRRKDLQAATQKLRGLEKGLHKLRLSSSKPDITSLESHSTGSIFSLNSLKGWPGFAQSSLRFGTKSCPTTPRGSVPDLSSESSEKSVISKIFNKSITPNKNYAPDLLSVPAATYSMASSRASSRDSSPFPLPIDLRNQEFSSASTSRVDSNRNSSESHGYSVLNEPRPQDLNSSFIGNQIPTLKETPIYANVGYKTSAPYTSAYRQLNYPTMHEHLQSGNRMNPRSTGFSSSHHYSTPQLRAPDPNLKEMPTSHSATNFGIKRPETYLPATTSSQFGIRFASPATTKSASDMPSMASIANSELGRIVQKMNGTSKQEQSRNHSPSSRWLLHPGYSTGSLDRRIVRARQAMHSNRGSHESPLKANEISSTSNGKVLTTTFPAEALLSDGRINETTTRSSESSDLKYRAAQNHHKENLRNVSAIHPNRLYAANWQQNPALAKDPKMESLLEHYKTVNNNNNSNSKTPNSFNSATMV